MTVLITLNNATASTTSVSINLTGNSANYVLKASSGVGISGTFTFNTLSVTAHSVNFGVAAGAAFTGTMTLFVQPAADGGTPIILVNNLNVDSATVTYPTGDGPTTQVLTPGTPLPLTGFTLE